MHVILYLGIFFLTFQLIKLLNILHDHKVLVSLGLEKYINIQKIEIEKPVLIEDFTCK